jgi:NADH dehydrogenase FAD-containing subunit
MPYCTAMMCILQQHAVNPGNPNSKPGRGRVKLVAGAPDILESRPPGQRAAARSVLSGKGVSVITDGLVLP